MLQFLRRITQKECEQLTPEIFESLITDEWLELNVKLARQALQEENKESYQKAKQLLPSVMWVGKDAANGKSRKASDLTPTQLYMVDIDHCKHDPREWWEEQVAYRQAIDYDFKIKVVHVTPSGKGLRIVAEATQAFKSVQEHMDWLVDILNLEELGDYDRQCRDLSRQSFLVPKSDFIYINPDVFKDERNYKPIECAKLPNGAETYRRRSVEPTAARLLGNGEADNGTINDSGETNEGSHPTTSEDRKDTGGATGNENEFLNFEYRGNSVRRIADKYVEVYGEPGEGERHNYYNQMVKNFRCICDNNPKVLHAILPRFGHSAEETLSQCESICRTNTLSRIPKDFYFFLKDNGFYQPRKTASQSEMEEYMTNTTINNEALENMPKLPPVIREIVNTMPNDYKLPAINGLMPILGTLTSHLRAVYPLDLRTHSTEFFSIVYAPPSTNKSFLERHMELLHEDLILRDMLSNERENLYNKIVSKKGGNEKSPDNPHVTLRIVEPKQSETDFLEKQQANKGHHMFTYAPEMDSWRKGVKAAGGNKDDMIRIAWDNGSYGQNFKSPNSFKGRVNLFWNVYICGTQDQLEQYFQNVENGLVTRCSFTKIKNQEFQDAPQFKQLTKAGEKVIRDFMKRCDNKNYREPLEFDPELLMSVSEENFDKEVPWRYEWKKPETVDMNWVMPTIRKFLKEQLRIASLDQDHARDVFRRRVAVRGFRMALLCTELYGANWNKPKNQKEIMNFIEWWMPLDLEGIMELFADKYNEIADRGSVRLTQKGVFELLEDTFDKNDVYSACKRLGKKTPVKVIIYNWKKLKAIKEGSKDGQYVKLKASNKL